MDNIRSLIPRNKGDVERAKAAVAAGYPAVAPILPQLLGWLQDANWPVAHVLIGFLGTIGTPMIPHVRHILETDDDIWKYWVLSYVVRPSPELSRAFRPELERFATAPTANEVVESLDEMAQEILDGISEP